MKNMRKLFSIIFAFILAFSCTFIVNASVKTAEILSIYSDGMLFKQNEIAVIEGIASPGSIIIVKLKDNNNKIISTGSATANSDGIFHASFKAPAGSFEEYSIVLAENGNVFRTLNNIVFGELWLAGGQSNMQYPLAQDKVGSEMLKNSEKLSKWLRVLLVPPYPEYNNTTTMIPALPQNDITDAKWITGYDTDIYSMSAVGYFFANKLMNEIDMPVGILNSNLGGSSICSWLSRDAIDATPQVKDYLKNNGTYIELNNWNEAEQNIYQDMTANYNQKIAPLHNFRLSGMIWYQGETDLMLENTQYDKQFDLLQKSYTDLFNHENGLLPIIYTQLASFYYSDDGLNLAEWNADFTKMQTYESESRAMISIYDIPVSYIPEAGLIHPQHKKEVGERMALSATGLVYNSDIDYSSPYVTHSEIKDNGIYVTFSNTNDTLICPDNTLKGFAVCDEDEIFIQADAKIVDNNTVFIWNDSISDPKYASYAYCVQNQTSNLFIANNGNITLPVSPFITGTSENSLLWFDKPWTDCDEQEIWYTEDDAASGYYTSWSGDNAVCKVSDKAMFSGNAGLSITSDKKNFSVSPTLSYKNGLFSKTFKDVQTDYSEFGTISFSIKNNGDSEIVFEGLKIYKNSVLWYSPAVSGTLDCATVIPADGKWHIITLDLNILYHLGNECSLSYDNEKIDEIKNLKFCFSSSQASTDICLDEIRFTATPENPGTRYNVDLKNADDPIEFFTGLILTIIEKIAQLFD